MIISILLGLYLLAGWSFLKEVASSKEFPWYFLVAALFLWFPVLLIIGISFIPIVSRLILKITGWHLEIWPEARIPQKSITIMAPHTSWMDAYLGKVALKAYGIPHKILSAAHLFRGPLGVFMKYCLQAIPIGGVPGRNAILDVCEYLKDNKTNIVICPEGHLDLQEKWNPGFWLMALKSEVPIVITTVDYEYKALIYLGEINPKDYTRAEMWDLLRDFYRDSHPMHPERFSVPQNK